ncbi:hypothetical protein NLG97_g3837 [Lecanicillium saksenae]|uniref:Uncharacterized protein n=1 Tax=Lecanicillium saksenae TaxID=468837 RepID=A0ACC1QWY6_9HYPO|nr:hypothetical protein NLG97_g3837 [Lecanicillium saksenae]
MENPGQRIAVIGLGALGLVTVKNLTEAGFDVTGFDKCEYVGGLWHFTEDDHLPEKFRGKRVVVAGLANTGSDVVEALRGIAKEIYISHDHGTIVFPRFDASGKPYDHDLSNRKLAVADALRKISPAAHEMMLNGLMRHMQNCVFRIRPEFRLSPAPSFYHALPTISDTIVRNLDEGHVASVPNIAGIQGPKTLKMTDDTTLEADSIIWCTGYRSDYNILDPSVDPTRHTTPRWKSARGSRGRPLARLYQNIFSCDFPESLAFMGVVWFPAPAFSTFDLAAMAVAQVWAGRSSLPPKTEMNRAIDEHHAWLCTVAERGSTLPGWVKSADWLSWAHGAAGTGLDTRFGWGLEGWKFWWRHTELYKLLSDGIISPHAYRLFEGKRKIWSGALEELRYVNRDKLSHTLLAKAG